MLSVAILGAGVALWGRATPAEETRPAEATGVVRVYFASAPEDTTVREFKVDAVRAAVVNDLEFELSASLEGAELEFLRPGAARPDLKVHLQYETSVSIMDDGPHLDLLDWKHHTSEWLELPLSEDGRAVLPVFSAAQQSSFPEVSTDELRAAVHAAGGDRWSDLLDGGSGVNDARVGIGVSTIRVRFTEDSGLSGAGSYVIEFPFPMGC